MSTFVLSTHHASKSPKLFAKFDTDLRPFHPAQLSPKLSPLLVAGTSSPLEIKNAFLYEAAQPAVDPIPKIVRSRSEIRLNVLLLAHPSMAPRTRPTALTKLKRLLFGDLSAAAHSRSAVNGFSTLFSVRMVRCWLSIKQWVTEHIGASKRFFGRVVPKERLE